MRDGFLLLATDAGAYRKYIGGAAAAGAGLALVRPDVVAIHRQSRALGLGDAKSAGDLDNDHTRRQLATMLTMRDGYGRRAEVFLAFPRSGLATASRTVMGLGLRAALRVTLLPIPDALLSGQPA